MLTSTNKMKREEFYSLYQLIWLWSCWHQRWDLGWSISTKKLTRPTRISKPHGWILMVVSWAPWTSLPQGPPEDRYQPLDVRCEHRGVLQWSERFQRLQRPNKHPIEWWFYDWSKMAWPAKCMIVFGKVHFFELGDLSEVSDKEYFCSTCFCESKLSLHLNLPWSWQGDLDSSSCHVLFFGQC